MIEKPKWLYCARILEFFSINNSKQSYQDFVLEEIDIGLKYKLERKNIPPILGTKEFMSEVKSKYICDSIRTDIPQLKILLRNLSPEPENIIQMVAEYFNIMPSEIIQYRRGHKNKARIIAIYLMMQTTKLNYKEVVKQFEGLSVPGISNVHKRVEGILKQSKLV